MYREHATIIIYEKSICRGKFTLDPHEKKHKHMQNCELNYYYRKFEPNPNYNNCILHFFRYKYVE